MLEKLKVVLEFASSGLTGTISAVKGLFSSVVSGAKDAGKGLLDLAKNFFYVKEAVGALWGVATKLFDTFIRGAGEAAKMEAKLKNVTGSAESAAAVMDLLDRVAKQTGADFNELAAGSSLLAVAAKDASGNFDLAKFTTLTDMLQRISALRPDVPIDRLARGLSTAVSKGDWSSLEMFLDVQLRQLIGIGEEAEKVGKVPGEIARGATYVEAQTAGAANEALKSLDLLDQALTKAGATAGIVADVAELSGMERFNETLQSIARTVGEPLFAALNKGLSELSDWLQENPELVEQLATSLGNLGAVGIEKAFAAISNLIAETDWETFFDNATEFFDKLMAGDVEGAFAAIGQADLGETLVSVADALKTIADVLVSVATALGVGFGKEKAPKGVGEALGMAAGGLVTGQTGERLKKSGWGYAASALGTIGEQFREDPASVGKAIAASLGGGEVLQGLFGALTGAVGIPGRFGAAIGEKVFKMAIDVNLNSAMLDAQVTQTSENVTAQAFNHVSRNMAGEE
uniref:Putative tail tape measure protein n=1 Tax=viral metagenome TaxID=1070528 RepID=A0A6M3IKD3_9ZZZZ